MASVIRKAQFSEILPIWRNELWAGRESVIEPVSAIGPNGMIDMRWYQAEPTFWLLFEGEKPFGTLSILILRGESVRLRGLWVSLDARGKSYGRKLIDTAVDEGRANGYTKFWTMTRQSAAGFYERCGFVASAKIDKFEFGPHIIMNRVLR